MIRGEADERVLFIKNISRLLADLSICAENLGLEGVGIVCRLKTTMLFRAVDISKTMHNNTEKKTSFSNSMEYTYFVCNLTFDVL